MYFSDVLAAIRWWVVLMVIGTAVTPFTFVFFKRLPDRGYAFTKMVGLLFVSYLFWILGSLGILSNNLGGIVISLLTVLAISIWYYRQKSDSDLNEWLRDNRTQIILTEIVFALIFALWVWVRAQNPAISATEKPMEFAFLNSVGRSPSFPPLDPWLSGFAISYYYFGYVMTSVLARLAAVPEMIAFNLGIAWLVAGTAVAAFGLVYNLIALRGARQSAILLGLIASLALPIAGNGQIIMEMAHANGIGSAEFWAWLDVRDISGEPDAENARYEGSSWWWWRSSRVIHEYHLSGRAEEGLEPIVEFPGFSFILGDMHPHVLSLPFAFLSLAVAFVWYLHQGGDRRAEPDDWDDRDWISRGRWLIQYMGWPLWVVTAVVLGGLSFLNTWDVLIHLFVVVAAFALSQWQRSGWNGRIISQSLYLALLLVIPAIILYLPFYLGFRSQAGAPYLLPMLMRPTRLPHFLIIFGMPLISIVILLTSLTIKQRFKGLKAGLGTAVSLLTVLLFLMFFLGVIIASSPDGQGRITSLASELNLILPPRPDGLVQWGWGLTAVFTIIPAVISAKLSYPFVSLLLLGIIATVVMIWSYSGNKTIENDSEENDTQYAIHNTSALPFALLLIFTATLLTLGPEFVYLRDNFGQRLNTTFKFYYQAWVMFGVAALFAIDYLWREMKGLARVAPMLATVGYTAVFVLALYFPIYGVRSRAIEYRGAISSENRQPATLDGLAQLKRFNQDEHDAIIWLRENEPGTPTILEAVGGQYSSFARISANTGIPTMLGWAGHELQWRGNSNPEPNERDPVVRQIYSEPNWLTTAALLDKYDVEYIYAGGLESSSYGLGGFQKFADNLEIAYQNNSVTIYRWQPDNN